MARNRSRRQRHVQRDAVQYQSVGDFRSGLAGGMAFGRSGALLPARSRKYPGDEYTIDGRCPAKYRTGGYHPPAVRRQRMGRGRHEFANRWAGRPLQPAVRRGYQRPARRTDQRIFRGCLSGRRTGGGPRNITVREVQWNRLRHQRHRGSRELHSASKPRSVTAWCPTRGLPEAGRHRGDGGGCARHSAHIAAERGRSARSRERIFPQPCKGPTILDRQSKNWRRRIRPCHDDGHLQLRRTGALPGLQLR